MTWPISRLVESRAIRKWPSEINCARLFYFIYSVSSFLTTASAVDSPPTRQTKQSVAHLLVRAKRRDRLRDTLLLLLSLFGVVVVGDKKQ